MILDLFKPQCTSNVALGVYPDYAHHSLPVLLAAGVPVTINSDDPPLFNTTLNNEVSLLHSAFHLDLDTINDVLLNGVRWSFLPRSEERRVGKGGLFWVGCEWW